MLPFISVLPFFDTLMWYNDRQPPDLHINHVHERNKNRMN